jgi:hypothetical protein
MVFEQYTWLFGLGVLIAFWDAFGIGLSLVFFLLSPRSLTNVYGQVQTMLQTVSPLPWGLAH